MRCGCSDIKHDPIEFKIDSTPITYINTNILLPNETEDDCCLMNKIIYEFLDIVNKLECGIQPDIENLLQEISLMDMKNNWNFSVAKEVYSSHPEEDDLLRKSKYLSEFETQEEKDRVLDNLGIDGVKHVILSQRELDTLDHIDENAIYFVTK